MHVHVLGIRVSDVIIIFEAPRFVLIYNVLMSTLLQVHVEHVLNSFGTLHCWPAILIFSTGTPG